MVKATLLEILVEALPLLREGLTRGSADRLADLLLRCLDVDAVSVVDADLVLGRRGAGSDHHRVGDPHRTDLTRRVLAGGDPEVARGARAIGCPLPNCPLTSAVVVPLVVHGRTVGALKFYRAGKRPISATLVSLAGGLGRILGVYLELADAEAQSSRVVAAELEACRAQVSPHFLFNMLNAIAALTRTDPAQAHDTLVDFAEFFRETLRSHGDLWTLDDELQYIRRYVALQSLRLGARLQAEYDVEGDTAQILVPVLAIQALVENAIIHGIEPKLGGGRVIVTARRSGALVKVAVEDDGLGIPPERLSQVVEPGFGTGLGIGLSNIDRRLRGLYGPGFGLRITSEVDRGTRVEAHFLFAGPAA
ncbi:MAG: histidine kinase [Candidatus Limnocylindria bacterium]